MLHAMLAESILLHHLALQPYTLKLDAFVLHVDVEVAIPCADTAVAFYDPGFGVFERWGEGDGVADEFAMAGGLVLVKWSVQVRVWMGRRKMGGYFLDGLGCSHSMHGGIADVGGWAVAEVDGDGEGVQREEVDWITCGGLG